MKKVITFDKNVTGFVLQAFGYEANKVGWIVDKKTREIIPGLDGLHVSLEEFAGIVNTPAGPRLVGNDIVSLVQLSDMLKP